MAPSGAGISSPSDGPSAARPSRTERDGSAPVAESLAFKSLLDTVERVAPAVVPVLILGETGSGKEVIARALHERGPRRDRPLGCVNCGGLPGQLVESTLFGHERGAFTGAHQRHTGVFEAAQGGTVLLDEIGELPLETQSTLLRVLETKRVQRVGSVEEVAVDVRIVAATHRDLEQMCREGTFRWDLYYRINVVVLRVPPLRARVADIAPLARRFSADFAAQNGLALHGVREPALTALERYDWPGNVRELKNVIDRAVVVTATGWIDLEHLPEEILDGGTTVELNLTDLAASGPPRLSPQMTPVVSTPSADPPVEREIPSDDQEMIDFKTQMQQHEVKVILHALERSDFNQTKAAKRLNMPLRTFVHKMKVLQIREHLRTDGPEPKIG